jgi:ATP-binding cassette subfamily C protein LapB
MARATRLGMDSGVSKQGILVETINGLETVQATGAGPYLKRRYNQAQISQSDTTAKTKSLSQFVVNVAASFQQFAQIAIIFFGVFLVRDGEITQGALIAAVILGGRAMAPMGQLANVLSRANGAKAAYRSLNDLFNLKETNVDEVFSISRGQLSGTIEFRNVSYSYSPDAQPIIESLNLKIPHGQKVALVGKMGSGKSTIAKIISGALRPTQGSILVDDIDLQQLDAADVTENIGVMPQDSWLFSGSIQDNITSGQTKYTDEDVLEVSKISTANEFISLIPQGYDFEIKEKGAGLSGGQKQAICLARSILNRPNILVLDEPTSSMDQQTETKVVENLNHYLSEKTLIVITHRNALLSICDRVLVVDSGKIIADSTPEQLGVKKLEPKNDA